MEAKIRILIYKHHVVLSFIRFLLYIFFLSLFIQPILSFFIFVNHIYHISYQIYHFSPFYLFFFHYKHSITFSSKLGGVFSPKIIKRIRFDVKIWAIWFDLMTHPLHTFLQPNIPMHVYCETLVIGFRWLFGKLYKVTKIINVFVEVCTIFNILLYEMLYFLFLIY